MLMVTAWTRLARAKGPSEADRGIVINEIHSNPDDEMELVEFVELYNAGDATVELAGWYFDDGLTYTFAPGTILPAGAYLIVCENPDHVHDKWGTARVALPADRVLGPYAGRLSNDGERLVLCNAAGQVVDDVEYGLGFPWPTVGDPTEGQTPGTGASMQRVNPSFDGNLPLSWRSALPTPLRDNSEVRSQNMHPFVREVEHAPQQPLSNEEMVVTARVSDADGVVGVSIEYQVVLPGHYIPGRVAPTGNLPGWTPAFMLDDGVGPDRVAGDEIYTARLPAQPHRALVRYRVQAMDNFGAATIAPYADDSALNFAYFVYDGVPDYEGFSSEMLQRLPVYHLLTRAEDMYVALGYDGLNQIPQHDYAAGGPNPDRFDYKWYGTFVYDGVVYDNIRYRLRGANGRYLGGNTKRSMRFRFNRGHYFQAKDANGKPYPTKWRTLTTAKGFDNRETLTYALNEHVNFFLYNKMGMPAPYSHYFHFRVIDAAEEAPDPWHGDFWGLGFAQETYDSRFLEAHELEKGNLYKLINSTGDAKRQQRYQAAGAVMDGSDHDNIQYRVNGSSTTDFIRAHVRLDKWYAYHALAQAIRHYDYWPTANKNAAWYFEPMYTPENSYLGLMWTLPWDTDASWGPTWNNGEDVVYDGIFHGGDSTRGELRIDYYNAVREVRDLLWQPDQIKGLLAEMAAPIAEFVEADRVRWLDAPVDAGNYDDLGGAGKYGLDALVEDMTNFAFKGGNWLGGDVGPGGRAAFLDELADGDEGRFIPDRPSITYLGDPGYPANGLRFQTSAFSDPQGSGSFGAMKWRLAEVSPSAWVIPSSDQAGSVLIPDGSTWRCFKGTAEPSIALDAWREPAFDDSAWATGQAAFGYGENFIITQLDDMRGSYSTVYLRRSFEVANLADLDTLLLELRYDDGIIVWINGQLACQENVASSELPHDAVAESAIENTAFVSRVLSDPTAYLVEGTNVIAVQVVNASVSGSSDCFVDVRLTARAGSIGGGTPSEGPLVGNGTFEIETLWESQPLSQFDEAVSIPASVVAAGRTYRVRCRMQDTTGRWSHWSDPIQFEVGTPQSTGLLAGLRISELMYNPAAAPDGVGLDNEDFEFIELKNIGEDTLDLSHVSFVEGVTFDFRAGAILTLNPGQFVLAVRNAEAFELRYGAQTAARIAGQYEGKLANEGESIKLVDFWAGTIAEFEYRDDDDWPASADGAGHSLVPLDSALADEPTGSLNDAANWRASVDVGGSPGRDDI